MFTLLCIENFLILSCANCHNRCQKLRFVSEDLKNILSTLSKSMELTKQICCVKDSMPGLSPLLAIEVYVLRLNKLGRQAAAFGYNVLLFWMLIVCRMSES